MEERNIVSCVPPNGFSAHTGISRVEATVLTVFESTFDEKQKKAGRYPVSMEVKSFTALFDDGTKISFQNVEQSGGEIDASNPNSICNAIDYVFAGQFGVIKNFIGTGNPYPVEQTWFVHTLSRKQVQSSEALEREGFLRQVGTDCIESIVRGWASSPGQHDLWCAKENQRKLKLVQRLVVLDEEQRQAQLKINDKDAQNYYWFKCDRSTGVGKILEKSHSISLGRYEEVTDQEISSRMEQECAKWTAD